MQGLFWGGVMGKGVAAEKFFISALPPPTHEVRECAVLACVVSLSLCSLFLPLLKPVLQRSKSSEINEPEVAGVKTAPFAAQL